ncbi:hypothetical protein pb186bvf_011986 [Paramecium bursaria]
MMYCCLLKSFKQQPFLSQSWRQFWIRFNIFDFYIIKLQKLGFYNKLKRPYFSILNSAGSLDFDQFHSKIQKEAWNLLQQISKLSQKLKWDIFEESYKEQVLQIHLSINEIINCDQNEIISRQKYNPRQYKLLFKIIIKEIMLQFILNDDQFIYEFYGFLSIFYQFYLSILMIIGYEQDINSYRIRKISHYSDTQFAYYLSKKQIFLEDLINIIKRVQSAKISCQHKEINISENVKQEAISNENKTRIKQSLSQYHKEMQSGNYRQQIKKSKFKRMSNKNKYLKIIKKVQKWFQIMILIRLSPQNNLQTKTINSQIFRLFVVWFRMVSCISVCLLYDQSNPIIQAIVTLRIFNSYKNYKQSSYLKNYRNKYLVLLLIVYSNTEFMVLIGYQCHFIKNQTHFIFF